MRTDCTLYQGVLDKDGYGRQWDTASKTTVPAHRLAYCRHHGVPIDHIAGAVVLHSCDTPACVEPSHLSLGTHQTNVADRVSKGRSSRGVKNNRAKLTTEQVEAIKAGYVYGSQEAGTYALSRKFGVSQRTICKVLSSTAY